VLVLKHWRFLWAATVVVVVGVLVVRSMRSSQRMFGWEE